MALGKSVGEIRSIPYDEFRGWKAFYWLEPFGWHDREYRLANVLTIIANTHRDSKSAPRRITDFIRDMPKAIERHVYEREQEKELRKKYENATPLEKARMVGFALGGAKVKRKTKK